MDSEMIGRRFGKLVVIGLAKTKNWKKYFACVCDCGKDAIIRGDHLKRGESESCGCEKELALKQSWQSRIKHGECSRITGKTAEWRVWVKMLARCQDQNDKSFPHYGGRGIRVCGRWAEYPNFLADMGRRPTAKHSIERIDNNGNYEPSNCRWATKQEQANNRRTNRFVTANGVTATLAEWERKTGISQNTILGRLRRGWSAERAVI